MNHGSNLYLQEFQHIVKLHIDTDDAICSWLLIPIYLRDIQNIITDSNE